MLREKTSSFIFSVYPEVFPKSDELIYVITLQRFFRRIFAPWIVPQIYRQLCSMTNSMLDYFCLSTFKMLEENRWPIRAARSRTSYIIIRYTFINQSQGMLDGWFMSAVFAARAELCTPGTYKLTLTSDFCLSMIIDQNHAIWLKFLFKLKTLV